MAESKEKVFPLNPDHSAGACACEEKPEKNYRDMGRLALFISLLTVVLVVVFFFGLNQNITGLNEEVKDLAAIRTQMGDMNTKLGDLEAKVEEFDSLPAKAKRMVFAGMLQDMAQRANAMSVEVEGEQNVDKLNQARALLLEVYEEMNKQ